MAHLIIPDIDNLIINLLLIPDLINLAATNKHFHRKITSMPLLIQCKNILSYKYSTNWLKFYQACISGFQVYAQYLFDHYKINIHKYGEYIFIRSCSTGHTNIAKWLIELGNNGHGEIPQDIIDGYLK